MTVVAMMLYGAAGLVAGALVTFVLGVSPWWLLPLIGLYGGAALAIALAAAAKR